MKRWKVLSKNQKSEVESIIKILLENREIRTIKEIEEFLYPKLENVTIDSVGIDRKSIIRVFERVQKAIKNNESIVIFGDYDVDGICGTAILWETLYRLHKHVYPYIPDRFEEGYGLSQKGIENLKFKIENCNLIITVDNGIVAHEAVEFAKKQGIDVIITDHHVKEKKIPDAYAIVHTTKLCGAGVVYLLSQEISKSKFQTPNKSKIKNTKYKILDTYLELVGLATIADMVPLTGANRVLAKLGIEALKNTNRPGLLALFQIAGLSQEKIGVYEIGHMIAPRLNATGRLASAMDSLRLICTKDKNKAQILASTLNQTNKERQLLTEQTTEHARLGIRNQELGIRKVLLVAHESYNEGIIGLVASKLVEYYYRPSFVVSIGEKISKGSARSINGVNIIEMIRSVSEHIVQAGGHPMAAGFTIETARIEKFRQALEEQAADIVGDELLKRTLRIDMELELKDINLDLYKKIQELSPFGIGNPEPTFLSRDVIIEDIRVVGGDGRHLKFKVKSEKLKIIFDAIAFGLGDRAGEFRVGDTVDIIYTIIEDTWDGNKRLQLKVKDIRCTDMLAS